MLWYFSGKKLNEPVKLQKYYKNIARLLVLDIIFLILESITLVIFWQFYGKILDVPVQLQEYYENITRFSITGTRHHFSNFGNKNIRNILALEW